MKTIITLIIAFFAISFTTSDEHANDGEIVTDVTFDDEGHAQEPDTTLHIINETEDTLSFEVGTSTLDICRLNEEADTLRIALSDDVGNFVSNVKIPLALVQQYVSSLPQSAA